MEHKRAYAEPGFLLTVLLPSGSVKKVLVQLDTFIRDVKEELELEDGVAKASRQRLMAGNVEMLNHKRLRDYGIEGDSVIRMEVVEELSEVECCIS